MAKFDLVKYSEKVKASRGERSNKETVGTRIMRMITGIIAAFMIWSTIVVVELPALFHNLLLVMLATAFVAYTIFVMRKQ
ncbi:MULTISPECIES: hypothetical protein [unclassified Fusibacter]|uniref:hypothetical protein n=1 Tax=unclassified Fusibacter TaxID=2624464 RepID=UPI00101223E4|nr:MULTISPECIES: hypothetical protein [unclassified Fusibacter]MCK8058302.1 hypothetical protein [Fusibacter sp. A2]NPE20885.1 hypothetical protein [Fusibacter sp. A1]RXV63089.1 hypothetical protein DWB64_03555 [Fusibacter sp. A1]